MAISTVQASISTGENAPQTRISWEEFQRDYLSREDGYDYEWLDGIVEQNPISMNKVQLFMLRNLQDFFIGLRIQQAVQGNLLGLCTK